MSRALRKQLFEAWKSLSEANEVLQRLYAKNNAEAIRNVLTDCQMCALAMGNRIEAVYGTEVVCIHCLEDYCETVYQMSVHINVSETWKDLSRLLDDQALQIKNSMEREIPDRQEVVFLPYKASMWDSLESIWMTVKQDEECDAFVVPIPYFDKNPDGSFRRKHYEGREYPDYVPIVRYDEYNLELRHPDVVYIHNPYDNYNMVTSVHPDFYSEKLKEYTDKLVYVPYFVLEEISPEDKIAIKSMQHFCTTPGVIYADQVIVQSENIKKIYVDVLTEATGKSEENRKYWENKILGLGSPKIDKVLNTRKNDIKIPEEWLKIIQKPDGSFKKIILYNTSLTALLKYNEKMLEKIKTVFQAFREKRDEVALLWRPHPLIRATIESMRPQLRLEYEKLVEEYKAEGWGIYDNTADLDRAVVLSDAYYGDGSSVVQLYQQIRKPVMIQDICF